MRELGLLNKSLMLTAMIEFGQSNAIRAEMSPRGATSMGGLYLGGFARMS